MYIKFNKFRTLNFRTVSDGLISDAFFSISDKFRTKISDTFAVNIILVQTLKYRNLSRVSTKFAVNLKHNLNICYNCSVYVCLL